MKHDKIIDKIRKLLSLSDSHNENEAFLAMKRARKLMDKHGVTKEDVENAKDELFLETVSDFEYGQKNYWVTLLQIACGKLNDCVPVTQRVKGRVKHKFQGFVADALVAKMTLDYLIKTCDRLLAASGVGGRSNINQFRIGFSEAVLHRVNVMVAERNKHETATTGTSLVVLKSKQIEAHFGKLKTSRLKGARQPTAAEREAFIAGSMAGANTSLDKQVNGKPSGKLTN